MTLNVLTGYTAYRSLLVACIAIICIRTPSFKKFDKTADTLPVSIL